MIKVEGPDNCDSLRDNMLKYSSSERQARRVSIFFEGLNPGKASVIVDLKKNRQEFIEILKNADVLITNVRRFQLRKLQLDYDQIKDELPHLVYAQVRQLSVIICRICASLLCLDTFSAQRLGSARPGLHSAWIRSVGE